MLKLNEVLIVDIILKNIVIKETITSNCFMALNLLIEPYHL